MEPDSPPSSMQTIPYTCQDPAPDKRAGLQMSGLEPGTQLLSSPLDTLAPEQAGIQVAV